MWQEYRSFVCCLCCLFMLIRDFLFTFLKQGIWFLTCKVMLGKWLRRIWRNILSKRLGVQCLGGFHNRRSSNHRRLIWSHSMYLWSSLIHSEDGKSTLGNPAPKGVEWCGIHKYEQPLLRPCPVTISARTSPECVRSGKTFCGNCVSLTCFSRSLWHASTLNTFQASQKLTARQKAVAHSCLICLMGVFHSF